MLTNSKTENDKLGFWGGCCIAIFVIGAVFTLVGIVKFLVWLIDVIIYLNGVV